MVEYEWDVEELDAEGEIISHHGFPCYTLAREFEEECAARNVECRVALVRNYETSRACAYVVHAYYSVPILPSYFQDAYGAIIIDGNSKVCRVPSRFHCEVARY